MKKYDGEAGSFSPWWSLKGYKCPKPKTIPQNYNEICSFFSDYPDSKIDIVTPIFKKSEDNTDYSKQYLTTEALESGTISFNIYSTMGTEYITSISYSTDDGNSWTTVYNVNKRQKNLVIPVSVNQGDKVLWKGDAQQTGHARMASFFSSDCEFNVYGNVMSLLYEDDFSDNKTGLEYDYQFQCLFSDFDEAELCLVVDASNLILPATTLAQYCYAYMFRGCKLLITAPKLPATTLTEGCYRGMFYGCVSLTTALALPATTLADMCYYQMFQKCVSLTTAPELPAATLVDSCYLCMFSGCRLLNYIKCLATKISAMKCTASWVDGVALTGTFVKDANMASWTTGIDGIPKGWTVQEMLNNKVNT